MGGSYSIGQDLVSVDATDVEAAADWASLRSPETYLGRERTQNFALFPGTGLDTRHVYAAPTRLPLNHWALAGDWTVQAQATVLHQAGGQIAYRFQARDLHLVMAPGAPGTSVRFRVHLDGQPPGAERTFEATFLDPGVQVYAFTFG